jgi:hypothetical protein
VKKEREKIGPPLGQANSGFLSIGNTLGRVASFDKQPGCGGQSIEPETSASRDRFSSRFRPNRHCILAGYCGYASSHENFVEPPLSMANELLPTCVDSASRLSSEGNIALALKLRRFSQQGTTLSFPHDSTAATNHSLSN